MSITVARSKEGLTFDAVSYTKTPCGKATTLKSTVKYVQPPPMFNKEEFLKGAKGNIDKSKVVYVPPVYGYGTTGYKSEFPYVPVRYRKIPNFGLGEVVTDENGFIIPKRELEDMHYNSMEGI